MNYGEFVNRLMLNPLVEAPLGDPITPDKLREHLWPSSGANPAIAVLLGFDVWATIVKDFPLWQVDLASNSDELKQGFIGYFLAEHHKVSIVTDVGVFPLLRGDIKGCAIVLHKDGSSSLFEVQP